MVTVFNALHGVNEFGEEITYRLAGSIGVKGFPEVTMRNMFAPAENAQPAAMQAAHLAGRALRPHLRQSLQRSGHRGREAGFRPGPRTPLGAPGERPHRRYGSSARRRNHARNRARSLPRRAHRAADSGEDSDLGQQGNPAHPGERRRYARPHRTRATRPSDASSISPPPSRCSIKSTRTIASTSRCSRPTPKPASPTKSCPRCRSRS